MTPPEHRPAPTPAVVGLTVLVVAGLVSSVWLDLVGAPDVGDPDPVAHVLLLVAFTVYAAAGIVLVRRQPSNAVGWILLVVGTLPILASPLGAWAEQQVVDGRPGTGVVAFGYWLSSWYWYVLLGAALVALPLLFPDGRLPGPRWRWVTAVPVAAVTLLVLSGMFQPVLEGVDTETSIANPVGWSLVPGPESAVLAVLGVGLLVGIVIGIVAVVVRWRRSTGVERTQMKLFLLGVAMIPSVLVIEVLGLDDRIGDTGFAVVLSGPAVAITVAVLKYRLYDLDRLVSRTVSWTVLTAVLVGVYAGIVVGTQAVLGLDQAPDLVVAGSTLAVAALFRPVRRRVQDAVDHRFNRRRTDAAHAVAAFATRVRDEVDLTRLADDLRHVADDVVRPGTLHLWLHHD